MNNKLQSIENVTEYINAFAIKLKNEGFVKKSTTDAKSHFARWLSIQLEKKKNETTNFDKQCDNSKYVSQVYAPVFYCPAHSWIVISTKE